MPTSQTFPRHSHGMRPAGFTLIELLVVIAVLGMLAGIVAVSLEGQQEKAELSRAKSFAGQIRHTFTVHAAGSWWFEKKLPGDIIRDRSRNGNDGQLMLNSDITPGECEIQFGRCFDLGPTSQEQHLFIEDSPSLSFVGQDELTMTAWIRADDTSDGDQTVLHRDFSNTTSGEYAIRINPQGNAKAGCVFRDVTGVAGVLSDTVLESERWHHIACIYDGSHVRVYINGVLDRRSDASGVIGGSASSGGVYIGGREQSGTIVAPFGGLIDEVNIIGEPIASGHIKQYYQQAALRYYPAGEYMLR